MFYHMFRPICGECQSWYIFLFYNKMAFSGYFALKILWNKDEHIKHWWKPDKKNLLWFVLVWYMFRLLSDSLRIFYPLAKARGKETQKSLNKTHIPSQTMRGPIGMCMKWYVCRFVNMFTYAFLEIIYCDTFDCLQQ